MRINLFTGGRRPWVVGRLLVLLSWWGGFIPGPLATFTFRPDLLSKPLARYFAGAALNLPQETLDTVLADWSDKQIEDAAMLSVPGLTPPEPRVAASDFIRLAAMHTQ